jgi:hypothetical protein
MEAQRYPEDFDGIIAGAPANNQTQLCAWRIAVEAKILQSPASVVPPAKLALLNRAVLAACDAIDGVTDGLLTDPQQCQFDPETLLCRGDDRDNCLTAQQNFSSIMAGMMADPAGRSRRATRSIIMQVCWQEWDRSSRIGCGSSRYPAWSIAEVGRDPTK